MTVGMCVGLCVRGACTCACTRMYTEVCKWELSSARPCSPPEVQPSASRHFLRSSLAAAVATLAFAVFCSCCWLLLFVLNFVLFCLDMSLHMESKMVRPGETPVAVVTLKGLCTRVFPVVPRELIAPCKTPLASFPWALVRLLTCVSPLVGL